MFIRPLFRITSAVLLAACLLFVPVSAKNGLPKAAQSVYALSWGGHNHCTISSINDKATLHVENQTRYVGLWLTAAHCVEKDEPFEIAGHPAFVVKADYFLDIAVMGTYDWAVIPLEFADRAPKTSEFIEMWGHPLGWESLIYFSGSVASPAMHEPDMATADMFVALYNLAAAPGSSGSAVLDKHHRIVGVLQFAFHEGGFASVSGGVTYYNLRAFLLPYLPENQ